MEAGRFEEMGHKLCRRLVVLLTEDDAAPTSVGHTMMVVATAWFMAAPLICVGGLMDRLLTCSIDPEQAFWQDDPQEVPAVVVDT